MSLRKSIISKCTSPQATSLFMSSNRICRHSQGLQRMFSTEGEVNYNIKDTFVEGRAMYLDNQATTPVDFRVLDAMLPYLTNMYGNPHSRTHVYGFETEAAVEKARKEVADLIGCTPREIYFTSGATESNNTIVKGAAHFHGQGKKHIITVSTEHKCVLDSCRLLQTQGYDITYLPVNQQGLVELDVLEAAMRPDTMLVSVMHVNNEIGTIQPIKEIGEMCKKRKIYFHTDAAQSVGKFPVNVDDLNVDLMSISGHKIYGPKGIGAMYIRRKPRVRISPFLSGGGQERNMRSGTVPASLAVGLGEAARVCMEEMDTDMAHTDYLSKKLYHGITSQLDYIVLNGPPMDTPQRYNGNLNLSFSFVEGESMLMALKEIAVSSGSACTSASLEPSYVLRALGVEDDMAHTSIRFGLGRFTTEKEVDHTINECVKHVRRLREMSPLYEMVQEGIDLKSIQWSN